MRIKEPSLLAFAAFCIFLALQPTPLVRKAGRPLENQKRARIAVLAIGLATLLLWYSLPSS
jgi:hypothetical protein